ncbi:alpha/beta hydrolase [Amorphus orientalis]|uniref:Phospholipase/carboxylesterase n=1 Tax=Amorphus orientalis TaxID=649198 RepID=A0AAE3VQQ9_9HYPH|nr:alpha/beta hydrolase [Amorphus orientalis]MDQ0316622.1 phospholipase/carboxylesterase [Amorphus orientalis]
MSDLYETVVIPGRADDPRTLLMLHGTGGDAESFAGLARVLSPGTHAIAFQGDVLENGMPRFFRRLREGVYDMDDLARATGKLENAVAEALAGAGRDPAQAILVGFSNGANLIASLLLAEPKAVPRAVLMHPLIPFEIKAEVPLGADVLVTAGRRDPIVPWPMIVRLVEDLRQAGASVDLYDRDGGHEVSEAEIAAIRDWLRRRPLVDRPSGQVVNS